MRKTTLLPVALATCLACIILLESCDKSFSRTDDRTKNRDLVFREGECESLCDDDCCCFVELDGSSSATLQFCGTSNGGSPCLGEDFCLDSFSGGGQIITLTTMNPKGLFCMVDNGGQFWIKNTSTTTTVDILISCIYDTETPMELQLGPQDVFYFQIMSGCELDPC